MKLLDIIMGYDCNSWCRYCTATDPMRSKNLTGREIQQAILDNLKFQPKGIRFGGGEPTRRRDLIPLVRFARKMHIPEVTVQTNGFLLSYPDYVDALIAAGVTRLNVSLRGHTRELHGDLTTLPETFDAVVTAVDNILARRDEVDLVLDVIITRQTVPHLEAITRFYAERGARQFNYWHVAREGKVLGHEADLVPRLPEVGKALGATFRYGAAEGLVQQSYYVPFCFIPEFPEKVWMPWDADALVVTPGARFRLEGAQIDIGRKVAACEECRYRERCFGVRPSYLEHFGEDEVVPVTEE